MPDTSAATEIAVARPVLVDGRSAVTSPPPITVAVEPTQVRRPWRSTVRTIFQATIAFALMWPLIVEALDLPEWSWVGVSLLVAGGVARVMALPQTEAFLRRFLPWLAAGGTTTPHNS